MFVGRRAVRRFSLLLLEEGEVYIKDFLAHCSWPAVVRAPDCQPMLHAPSWQLWPVVSTWPCGVAGSRRCAVA